MLLYLCFVRAVGPPYYCCAKSEGGNNVPEVVYNLVLESVGRGAEERREVVLLERRKGLDALTSDRRIRLPPLGQSCCRF